ncbi:fungal-specific transcription factor domain-containing protein, partial [Neohortaea acidophila]
RRRAAKACFSCNARKVRCDVTANGAPCTNCRLDEIACTIPVRKRRQGTEPHNDAAAQAARPSGRDADDAHIRLALNFGSVDGLADLSPHSAHSLPERYSRNNQNPSLATGPSVGPRRASAPLLHEDRTQSMGAHASYGLPRYISPLPPQLGVDEIALLRKKNALNLPSPHLQDALLQSFIEYTYPSMPVLNLHEFLTAIERRDGKHTISLLLLQAVLFAGVATVDIRHLRHAGYQTRQTARRDFFQKVRLLYNFDCERDEVILVQSLLLMSCWGEVTDDGKDSSHWISIANSLCHNIGLQAAVAERNQKEQALWKRLRWVAYMREILVALDLQRAPQAGSMEFDIPMLTAEDFEIVAWRRGEQHLAEACLASATPTMQQEKTIICAEQAKLCLILRRLLSLHYNASQHQEHSALARQLSAFIEDTAPFNLAGGLRGVTIQECGDALRGWEGNLAPEARWTQPSRQDINNGQSSIIVQRLTLRILFLTAILTLYRPLPPSSPLVEPVDQLPLWTTDDNSTELVRQTASEITEIATMALGLGLVSKLPTTFVSALRAAVAVH